ncbi:DUF1840 domain-containing protein [Sedimenticola sp.]|uniref:DUF1840 domain-containing protein n=1 Tax=Sedimenticola sp. TaxID=1940285 RepID=UPI003D0F21EA
MLVTFTCPAYANITMFGDIATRLLHMMGHSGTVPSAILADEIHGALTRLEAAIEAEMAVPGTDNVENNDDEEPVVPLAHRALPLIELLKAADKEHCDVMWRRGS